MQLLRSEISHNLLVEQFPVGISPAINTLLYIAHHQIKFVGRQTVVYQREKVFPLQRGRILKLINHKMIDMHAGFFVHKRRVAVVDNAVEQHIGIRNKHGILLFGKFFYLHSQIGQNTEGVEMFQYERSCVVVNNVLRKYAYNVLHILLQTSIISTLNGIFYVLWRFRSITFRNILCHILKPFSHFGFAIHQFIVFLGGRIGKIGVSQSVCLQNIESRLCGCF